ncbi:MAG: carboxypeptidase regulatory-like domain-containing protein, partial [Flavobacteriia bacterium]|nr:carboxypeptidase regulatory-like domain-containing protein [Flavobacteriia bacterium]
MKNSTKPFVFYFFLMLLCSASFAQTISISGTVNDSSGTIPLQKAVVSLVRLNDSTLLDFQRTTENGNFHFAVPIDTFILIFEHPQFESKTLYVFGNPNELNVDIPFVRMGVKVKNLAEVVVQGNKNRVYYKGDTLVYVADSFKVAENAVVEDLLKKLPGIKIDENGQITSQGREISQVLVDGDEFFGTDPTIATKNLGAKGVESVQIYEKKAQDNTSGMDEKIQVMDLKLKADAKRGYFGKASLATDAGLIGSPTTNFPFYEGELLFNRFDKKQKFSVFLLSSNTPRSNFRFGDMNKFGLENERDESGMSMWNQRGQRTNAGIPQTLKAGIYFNDRIKNWGKIGFNYSYNQNQLLATQSSLSQYFLQDTSYFTKDSISNKTLNSSHKINLSFSAKLDSLTTFEIKPSITLDEGTTENKTINAFQTESMQPTFTSEIDNNNDSKGYNARLESTIYRLFKKPRRELEVKYILNKTDNQTDGTLLTQSIFSGFTDSINQQKENNNGSQLNYGIITYKEPISPKWKIQMEYFVELGNSFQTRNTYSSDLLGTNQRVDSLSNAFENKRF